MKNIFVIISSIVICNAIVIIVTMLHVKSSISVKNCATTLLRKSIKNEKKIITLLYKSSHRSEVRLMFNKHENNLKQMMVQLQILKNRENKNKNFMYATVAMLAILTFGIYMLIVYLYSRMVGPLHVMANKMKEMLEGKKPEFQPLRDGDELKDFYADFIKIIVKD